MGNIKFDVSGSDPEKAAAGGGGVQVPPGVYTCKVLSIEDEEPEGKDRRLHIVFEVISGAKKYKGAQLHEYINLVSEAAVWKLDQFLLAFGIASKKKRKGQFNPDKLKGERVKIRVRGDSYTRELDDGTKTVEYRAKVGAMLPLGEDEDEEGLDAEDEDHDDDDVDDEEEEETEDDDDDEDEDDEEDEDEDEDDDEEEDDEDEEEDYASWPIAKLRKECKSREIDSKGTKATVVKRLQKHDKKKPY